MSYHYHKKKKKRLQRGEKLVLKFGIPASIVVAILIQLTVRGVPAFFDRVIDFIEKEAWRSRTIIAGYAAKKAKDARFRTEKKFKTNESYQIGSTYGSGYYEADKESIIKQFEKYRVNQRDADDPVYQEIKRRELKEEIEDYQKIFEEEKDSR
ncbi:MAG: hypothetical protein J7L22_11850 [Candidatus Marinimicrobia bacterium]|nr:hypothetical protein [Candidatus Neomarinimicrobiota bacterium]